MRLGSFSFDVHLRWKYSCGAGPRLVSEVCEFAQKRAGETAGSVHFTTFGISLQGGTFVYIAHGKNMSFRRVSPPFRHIFLLGRLHRSPCLRKLDFVLLDKMDL